jgi:hypothetical protein
VTFFFLTTLESQSEISLTESLGIEDTSFDVLSGYPAKVII